MRFRWCSIAVLIAAPLLAGDEQFNGRWVIEAEPPHQRALWLKVTGAGSGEIGGRFVGAVAGRSQPLLNAKIENGELSFLVERYREDRKSWDRATTRVRLDGDKLRGITRRDNDEIKWVGRRAKPIADRDDGSWREGEPVVLFDGSDLSRWHTGKAGSIKGWSVKDGVLHNSDGAPLLISNDKFWNFELHIEYRVAPHSNSGIGLRSRYEVQILDDHGKPPSIHGNGAIYSEIKPSMNSSLPPDRWQTFDISLVGRDVTVVLNGKTIIPKTTIEGLTAMATDWRETEAGPITLQGDHGPIEFREIVVTPLVK